MFDAMMSYMRTTLRIDDDLLRELRQRAEAQKVPLTKLVNQALRQALASRPAKRVAYREKVHSMGTPKVNLDKALAIAAAMEDEEVARKLAVRK